MRWRPIPSLVADAERQLRRRYPWAVTAAAVFFGLAIAAMARVHPGIPLRLGDPVTFIDVRVVTPRVPPGGTLTVRVTADKRRHCSVTATPLVINTATDLIVELEPRGRIMPLGLHTRVVPFLLPPTLAPGSYQLEILPVYDCPDGRYSPPITQDLLFEVTSAPPSDVVRKP
jgi:hypothetical protein